MANEKLDINKLSFEDSIKLLAKIVDNIERGETKLEDSLGEYEKGMKLIKHCKDILDNAEKRIEKISKGQPEESQPS